MRYKICDNEDEKSYNEWISQFTENFEYFNPAPQIEPETSIVSEEEKQFPIIAGDVHYPNCDKTVLSKEELEQAQKCGFNVCSYPSISNGIASGGNTYIINSLENAKKAKVTLIFNTDNFYFSHKDENTGIKETIKGYMQQFGGINLYDEPYYNQIVGDPDTEFDTTQKDDDINKLRRDYKDLMQQDVPKLIYINLVGAPGDRMPNEGDTNEAYEEYLNAFQDNFKPSFFCYDLYPIKERSRLLYEGFENVRTEGTQEGEIIVEKGKFYYDFELYRKVSQEHDRPFWAFCQSLAFMKLDPVLYRPVALESYLSYEAFSALAYGAKGIRYWNYAMNDNGDNSRYFSALLNRRNEKTASWFFAKKINNLIHKYRNIFLLGKVTKISCVSEDSYNSEKLNIIINTSSSEQEIVVSEINVKGDTDYVMMVNQSPLDYVEVIISIGTFPSITEMTPSKSGGPENQSLMFGTYRRTLIPGGFILLKKS